MTIPDHSARSLTDLLSLAGRVAVVTGAARGIGAQIVRRLAEAGADVVAGDLDADGAAALAAEVADASGRRVIACAMDVTDTTTLAAAADLAVRELGRLDIWVNNAGIFPTTGPAIEATDEFIDRLLQVNTRGSFAGAREAAKRMTHGGVIINMLSTTAFKGNVGISAYITSKHALVGTTKALALEFGPMDIRVLGVAPSFITTPGTDDQLAPLKAAGLDIERRVANNPLGRAGVPDDIARVVVFACSDLSAYMTGSTLAVDAGSLAG
ncbi:MAG: SDR family oxidoreductase [Ilumatobacteraceae bacterium]|nr:SDR family oxidoreductase [Ilumatobacter sp.]